MHEYVLQNDKLLLHTFCKELLNFYIIILRQAILYIYVIAVERSGVKYALSPPPGSGVRHDNAK
jgi:hypothetical protein